MRAAITNTARPDAPAKRAIAVDDLGRPFTSWAPVVDRAGHLVGFQCGRDADLWGNALHVARDVSAAHSATEARRAVDRPGLAGRALSVLSLRALIQFLNGEPWALGVDHPTAVRT